MMKTMKANAKPIEEGQENIVILQKAVSLLEENSIASLMAYFRLTLYDGLYVATLLGHEEPEQNLYEQLDNKLPERFSCLGTLGKTLQFISLEYEGEEGVRCAPGRIDLPDKRVVLYAEYTKGKSRVIPRKEVTSLKKFAKDLGFTFDTV